MPPENRLLLVRIDRQASQIVADALAETPNFRVEVTQPDPSRQIVESRARWDAVIVCAGNESLSDDALLSLREHLGFCPLVVVSNDPPSDNDVLAPEVLTIATSDFSPRTLQLLLRASAELKSASAKLAGLEATARIKSDLLAKQNEFIHQLTSRMCHEVRSPLTAARQYNTLIARQQADDGNAPQLAGRALRSLDDLSMLVDDMSAFSQWEVSCRGVRRRIVSLSGITREIEHLLRERARLEGIGFEVRLAEDLPEVFADPDAVGQAVRNLVVNSLQHATEGERVQLWAEPDGDGQVLIGIEDQFDHVDPSVMEEAFQDFCNAEISLASGLEGRRRGLAVARRLLELNLSELRLESLGERGSVFVFQLPSADPAQLIEYYLKVLRARGCRARLSLLTFSADGGGQFDPGSAIDDFLQTSTTADDLVLQTGARRWTALVCGNRHEVAGRLSLLDATWALRRERDAWLELPAIRWQQHDSWIREADDEAISAAFLEACGIEQAADGSGRRILLVDNHPERVLRLTHQFESAGYDVIVARDDEEGISSATENHPDAIVWDGGAPESNAAAALQKIRSQDTSCQAPVIMLASNMRQQQQALEQGAKTIFGESLHANQVVEAVQSSLAVSCPEPTA